MHVNIYNKCTFLDYNTVTVFLYAATQRLSHTALRVDVTTKEECL